MSTDDTTPAPPTQPDFEMARAFLANVVQALLETTGYKVSSEWGPGSATRAASDRRLRNALLATCIQHDPLWDQEILHSSPVENASGTADTLIELACRSFQNRQRPERAHWPSCLAHRSAISLIWLAYEANVRNNFARNQFRSCSPADQ